MDTNGHSYRLEQQRGQDWNPHVPPASPQQPAPLYPPPGPQGCNEQPPVLHQPLQQQHHHHTSNTTVVVTQQQAPATGPRGWSSGLCSCFDDWGICLLVDFCYCCALSKLASDTGEHCCTPCCVPNWLTALRTKVRAQLGIQGSICEDCLVFTYCRFCALCQLMREVKIAKQNGLM